MWRIPNLDELQSREQEIGALRDDPRFQALRSVIEEQEAKFWEKYTSAAKRGRPLPAEEVLLKREFFRGAWQVLDEPHDIEKKLQNELRERS